MKEIPQMLQILDDHTEENLDQEEWEDRLLQAFLYKFFGFTLRTSRNMKLVKMMLSSILQAIHEDLQEREGIAVALSIVSMKHLKMVLDQLQVYSAILTDKGSSFILKLTKEHQQREWGLVCNIIYLSYSKIILASKGDIFTHLDDILAVVLQHHRNCIVEKELIREEPLSSISSSIRLRAMNIISDFRKLRPLIEVEERTELLRTCRKSVLCLPPTEILQKEASSSQEAHTTVDLFRETLQSLLRLMETLTVEMPSRIQHCLELLDTWLNSQKDNERERAMWCAARILGFTAKMNNFGIEEIVEGILERLNSQLEPNTKEETLWAMCLLAGNNTHNVMPLLLNKALPWDRTNLALWKAFGTQRETTISILQLLIGILEQLHSTEETKEMASSLWR
ncbi:maestro heat-like repeat-containing protein family member 2B [Mirounga angustirostris]|uniref:maestro heat-like repeat-containing protein family member 2B n=1 Tax=Mirounga angustirostris TaxID=9716 RepID=UPI001E6860E7|nr:maestro heat-like repeat-containing protein family member 2B [Mirounga angustirostris]